MFLQILDYIESAKVISVDCDKNTRLLDAKEIIRIAESEFSEEDMFKIRWLISHTPTTIILDNIVEKLEENSFDMSLENPDCKAIWTDKAINIVKQEINNGLE